MIDVLKRSKLLQSEIFLYTNSVKAVVNEMIKRSIKGCSQQKDKTGTQTIIGNKSFAGA